MSNNKENKSICKSTVYVSISKANEKAWNDIDNKSAIVSKLINGYLDGIIGEIKLDDVYEECLKKYDKYFLAKKLLIDFCEGNLLYKDQLETTLSMLSLNNLTLSKKLIPDNSNNSNKVKSHKKLQSKDINKETESNDFEETESNDFKEEITDIAGKEKTQKKAMLFGTGLINDLGDDLNE